MSLPEAIFFDWDGTLVDSFSFLEGAHDHVHEILKMTIRGQGWFEGYFGMPREKLYTDIYGEKNAEAKAHFENYVINHHCLKLKPMDGAEDLLDLSNNMKIKMGVVTNKKGDFVRREIEHFGWEPHFSSAVAAGEAEQDKPAADPLLKAVKDAGVSDAAHIWYVGDTEIDLQCAQSAGISAVFLHPEPESCVWLKDYDPVHVVRHCGALKNILLGLNEN